MNKNNSSIAILLEILNPGFGFIYYKKLSPGNITLSLIGLLITILLIIFVPSETRFWGYTKAAYSGIFSLSDKSEHNTSCALIFWITIIIFTRGFLILILYDDIKRRNEVIINQYSSDKLLKELNKLFLLKKEDVINEGEYKKKIEQIFIAINKFGIPEDKEDFLIKVIPLKETGIITQEILNSLKNCIL